MSPPMEVLTLRESLAVTPDRSRRVPAGSTKCTATGRGFPTYRVKKDREEVAIHHMDK